MTIGFNFQHHPIFYVSIIIKGNAHFALSFYRERIKLLLLQGSYAQHTKAETIKHQLPLHWFWDQTNYYPRDYHLHQSKNKPQPRNVPHEKFPTSNANNNWSNSMQSTKHCKGNQKKQKQKQNLNSRTKLTKQRKEKVKHSPTFDSATTQFRNEEEKEDRGKGGRSCCFCVEEITV